MSLFLEKISNNLFQFIFFNVELYKFSCCIKNILLFSRVIYFIQIVNKGVRGLCYVLFSLIQWFIALRKEAWKVTASNPTGCSNGLWDPTSLQGFW